MKLVYFAFVRRALGVDEETVTPPANVRTVAALIEWLKSRGPRYAEAFKNSSYLRAAVNQEHVSFDHAVGADDEIALFPPVTGGAA